MKESMTAANAAQNGKKTMTVKDVVDAYDVLKTLKITKLPREGQLAVLRASRALKTAATEFDDFVKDARERLKPDNFDTIVEMSQRFDSLTEAEKAEVNYAAQKYQRAVDECATAERGKTVEVDSFEPFTEEWIADIAAGNDLSVQALLLLGDI